MKIPISAFCFLRFSFCFLLFLAFQLFSFSAFSQATLVTFPLNSLFGGAAYNKPITITAANTLISDGQNLWAGTYTIIPASTTNPVVGLYPNTYLMTVQGVATPVRFSVPASTNVLDVTTLLVSGPLFYFGTNSPFLNLTAGTNITFATNAGSVTINGTVASFPNALTNGYFTNGTGVAVTGDNKLAIGTNNFSLASNGVTIAYLTNSSGALNTNVLALAGFGTAAVNGTYTNVGNVNLNGSAWRWVYTNMLNNGVFLWSSTNGTSPLQWYLGTNVANACWYYQSAAVAAEAPTNANWIWNSAGGANSTVGSVNYYSASLTGTNFLSGPVWISGGTNVVVTIANGTVTISVTNSSGGLTNFSNFGSGAVQMNGQHDTTGILRVGGQYPLASFRDNGDGFTAAAIGYDNISNGSKAGLLNLFGAATMAGGNICGINVFDTNDPESDNRSFVLRVKSVSPGAPGGYVLFESHMVTTAPAYNDGFTQITANWIAADEFGRIGLGELGQASDAPGTTLHHPFEVSIYGSYTGAYPQFGFAAGGGVYKIGSATNGAMGFDNTNFYVASTTAWRQIVAVGTNRPSMTTGGITNNTPDVLRLIGFTGTAVVWSNSVIPVVATLGTISTPTDKTLQPKESLTGSSCAAIQVISF